MTIRCPWVVDDYGVSGVAPFDTTKPRVDVDKLLADEDDDHSMGASVDEVIEENDENAGTETAGDAEDSQESSDTMEDESTESNHVCSSFYINDVVATSPRPAVKSSL